jgi:hypothetical protein
MSNIEDSDIKFFDRLDEDEQRMARDTMNLRLQNANIVADIERNGGEVEVTMARLEHFMESLVDMGIIMPGDLWREQNSWEKSLRSQLKPIRERLADVHTTPRPVGKRLILPPGARR